VAFSGNGQNQEQVFFMDGALEQQKMLLNNQLARSNMQQDLLN